MIEYVKQQQGGTAYSNITKSNSQNCWLGNEHAKNCRKTLRGTKFQFCVLFFYFSAYFLSWCQPRTHGGWTPNPVHPSWTDGMMVSVNREAIWLMCEFIRQSSIARFQNVIPHGIQITFNFMIPHSKVNWGKRSMFGQPATH